MEECAYPLPARCRAQTPTAAATPTTRGGHTRRRGGTSEAVRSHCGRHKGSAASPFHCSLRSDRAETLWLALVLASTNSGLVIFGRPLISSAWPRRQGVPCARRHRRPLRCPSYCRERLAPFGVDTTEIRRAVDHHRQPVGRGTVRCPPGVAPLDRRPGISGDDRRVRNGHDHRAPRAWHRHRCRHRDRIDLARPCGSDRRVHHMTTEQRDTNPGAHGHPAATPPPGRRAGPRRGTSARPWRWNSPTSCSHSSPLRTTSVRDQRVDRAYRSTLLTGLLILIRWAWSRRIDALSAFARHPGR